MTDKEIAPTGFVAKCRCGVIIGAMDFERTDRKEAGLLLGEWLFNGCTVEPRFGGEWSETIIPCECKKNSRAARATQENSK